MKTTVQRLGPLALPAALFIALVSLSPGAIAAGMSASSASDSASSAASSASDSLQGSSNSSSRTTGMAAGNYELVQVAQVAERPMLRMTLAPVGDKADQTQVLVPQDAFAQSRLTEGETVAVRERPYGLEFVNAKTQEAFFLVLADAWHQELAARPVQL